MLLRALRACREGLRPIADIQGALLCIMIVHTYLISAGSFILIFNEQKGWTFDTLADSLLKGDVAVRWHAISLEAIISPIDYKIYTYFGLFPALMRVVPNLLFPILYGGWSRVMCLSADLLGIIAIAKAVSLVLEHNVTLQFRERLVWKRRFVLAYGLATPLIFLISEASIYHEAIVWGLCGATWGLLGLTRAHLFGVRDDLALFYVSIGLAVSILSRLTFAVPWLGICFLLVALRLPIFSGQNGSPKLKNRSTSFLMFAASLCIACGSLATQCWYNYKRFDWPFSFTPWKEAEALVSSTSGHSHWLPWDETAFNIRRVKSTFLNYVVGYRSYFINSAPFVRMRRVEYGQDFYLFRRHPYRESQLALSVSATWLLTLGILGTLMVFTRKSSVFLRLSTMLVWLEWMPILMFVQITQRYLLEFLPALLSGMMIFLSRANFQVSASRKNRAAWRLILLMMLFSASCNILSAIDFIARDNKSISFEDQEALRIFLYRIDDILSKMAQYI